MSDYSAPMHNSNDFDIAIIGGGCIGASIFFALCSKGFTNIALVDQGRKTVSASSQSGGMLRVFHENRQHIELALLHQKYLSLYQNLKVVNAQQTSTSSGTLYFFHKNRLETYQSHFALLKESEYPFNVISAEEGRERFSCLNWAANDCAVFEPSSHHLDPNQLCQELIEAGKAKGATLYDDFEVLRICNYMDRYRIAGPSQTITAKCVVLAGGARLLPRLSDLGIQHQMVSQTLRVFKVKNFMSTLASPSYFDRESLEFARLGSNPSILLSTEQPQRIAQSVIGPQIKQFETIEAQDCYAPNRLGPLGQISGKPRLFIASGWGGTGFKFSLAVAHHMSLAIERAQNERTIYYGRV